MKKLFKIFSITVLAAVVLLGVIVLISLVPPSDLNERVVQLKEYCNKNGYTSELGVLVDYSRVTFQKRFYVYDFKQDKILMSTFAGHGNGGKSTLLKADFSNVPESHCSSLGHYRIGCERKMYTRNCNAFELDGLETTNSNARKRSILIHPSAYPLSWGCVTLNHSDYNRLSKILGSRPNNVIMWVYN